MTTLTTRNRGRANRGTSAPAVLKSLARDRSLLLLALPGSLLLFLFSYLPLIGILIAFKDFKFGAGIFGSAWQKPVYYNFIYLFTSSGTLRATLNTLSLNCVFILSGVLAAVTFALLLNEIVSVRYRKLVQSFSFLPYFMSWIVVGVFVYGIFSEQGGALNGLITAFGGKRVDWYTSPEYWPAILLGVTLWKFVGYNAVIYLATITGIDPTIFEAAQIDGASRMQQAMRITLPMLLPTMTILVLLQIGRIMNADFGMFYGIVGDNSLLYPTTDVLDTFIYRNLRKLGDIGMSSAAGLYQSVISFALLLVCNGLARKMQGASSLF